MVIDQPNTGVSLDGEGGWLEVLPPPTPPVFPLLSFLKNPHLQSISSQTSCGRRWAGFANRRECGVRV